MLVVVLELLVLHSLSLVVTVVGKCSDSSIASTRCCCFLHRLFSLCDGDGAGGVGFSLCVFQLGSSIVAVVNPLRGLFTLIQDIMELFGTN